MASTAHIPASAPLCCHMLIVLQALNLAAEVLTSDLRRQYDSKGTAALPGSRYKFLLEFLKQGKQQSCSAAGLNSRVQHSLCQLFMLQLKCQVWQTAPVGMVSLLLAH